MKKPHGNTGRPRPDLLQGEKALSSPVSFRLPRHLKLQAEQLASERGVSMSELCSDAVERYLAG